MNVSDPPEIYCNITDAIIVGLDTVSSGGRDVSSVIDENVARHIRVEHPETTRIEACLDSRGSTAGVVRIRPGRDSAERVDSDSAHCCRRNDGGLVSGVDSRSARVDFRTKRCANRGAAGPVIESKDSVLREAGCSYAGGLCGNGGPGTVRH